MPQPAASLLESDYSEELELLDSDVQPRPPLRKRSAFARRADIYSPPHSPPALAHCGAVDRDQLGLGDGLSESRWPLQGALREVYLWGINGGGKWGDDEDGEGMDHGPDAVVREDANGTVRGRAPRVEYTPEEDRAMQDYYRMFCTRCVERERGGTRQSLTPIPNPCHGQSCPSHRA